MTDAMRIWKQVEKTNPAHTKHVTQRGGFTAISANYQIMRATEVFGPVGEGWGYVCGDPIFQETLMIVPVTLWYDGDRNKTFGPMFGCEEWKNSKGFVDSDAPKKATTDAITKLLSHLGFNADVFLGLFDDQKYVAAVTKEFAAKEAAAKPAPDPTAKINDTQREWLIGHAEKSVGVAELCKEFGKASLKEFTVGELRRLPSEGHGIFVKVIIRWSLRSDVAPVRSPLARATLGLRHELDFVHPHVELRLAFIALVRAMAASLVSNEWVHHSQARAILALLPEPVDPDLIEAREIAAREAPSKSQAIRLGDYDNNYWVLGPLVGIRRGRELAAGEA